MVAESSVYLQLKRDNYAKMQVPQTGKSVSPTLDVLQESNPVMHIYANFDYPHCQQRKIREHMNSELNYYSPSQIAALLSISPKTVYRWIERRELPAVQMKKGGVYRVPAAAVRSLLATGEAPALEDDLAQRAATIRALEMKHGVAAHG